MSSYEQERYALHQTLESQLGADKAATLMSYLPPVHWGEVATKHDLAIMRDQMATKVDLTNAVSDIRQEISSWSRALAVSIVGSILSAVALSFAAVHLR